MNEIICINDKFDAGQLQFYSEHGVKTPIEGKIYSPRSITRNSEGKWEVLLVEIVNPLIPIKHPIMRTVFKEPAWSIHRFKNLDNTDITTE